MDEEVRYRLLYDLSCAFAARIEIDQLIPLVVTNCREALHAEGASVLLLDDDRKELYFPYISEEDPKVGQRLALLRFSAELGIAAAALKTSRIRLGTGVLVPSNRIAAVTANAFATLNGLAPGRIDFGIGVGWNKEEVEACGYRWEDRGARCDEFLEVMRRLWTEPVVDFSGKWLKFETMRLDPKPIQKPHVPIIVGGYADAALRREYRRGLLRVARRRPAPAILQLYALKCAMHFHVHMMVQEMLSAPRPVVRAAA